MKRRQSLAIAVSVTFAAVLGACGKKEEAAAPKAEAPQKAAEVQTVRIGAASPLTGPQAHIGIDIRNGVQLAIEDANAAGVEIGGRKVKLRAGRRRRRGESHQGRRPSRRSWSTRKSSAVVGHFNSGASIPASKIYSDAGIPQISPSSTNPKYTQQGFKTTFRVVAHDDQQGPTLGRFALDNLKAKTIAVIDDSTAYGQGLADAFERTVKAGGRQGRRARAHAPTRTPTSRRS